METPRTLEKSATEVFERETARLAELQKLDLLDTPRDDGFDRIVRLIKQIFGVDIALMSVIDAHRQWYKACWGLAADEQPRRDTFCRYVIDCDEPLVVRDAVQDPRFSQHPAVAGEAHIRFYASVPLRAKNGAIIGTMCAIDRTPRSFDDKDLTILKELADAAMDRIELLQLATIDSLTEFLTRRAFRQEAERLISLALRHRYTLSCIVLDIDHFKRVNDTYGHAEGDQVLKAVASTCKSTLRKSDLFGRLGGEEFAIILPHVDRENALIVAEKLRTAIASAVVPGAHGGLGVTASLGVSTVSIVAKDIETLLSQADIALYQAKQQGRNRCISWSSVDADEMAGARQRVLKAGSIMIDDRNSIIDCTVKSLGSDSAGISVSSSVGIPEQFVLIIKEDGFETGCRVISRDLYNLEVSFQ